MTSTHDTPGLVFNRSTATLLARVVDIHGDPVSSSDIASAEYTVYEVDECDPVLSVAVPGHESVALTPSTVLFDSLQTAACWTTDEVGYNFRHDLDVTAQQAFPTRGRLYQVRYELTPNVGQKVVFRFSLRAI